MTKEKHILLFLYYSMRDPLCEGLMLSYLRHLQITGIHYHLITYEQERYLMSPSEEHELKKNLKNTYNISWHPIAYRSGNFFFIKKLISAYSAFTTARKIKKKHPLHLICAMATPVGTYAYFASRWLRIPMCQFTFEPHAQIMMQSGQMSPHSIKYKVAHWLEMKIGLNAEYVVCTTKHMVDDLQKWGARGKVFRLPTSVNEIQNSFDQASRDRIRQQFELEDKTVLIYPGKFGGMYRTKSAITLMACYLEKSTSGHLLMITDYDHNTIKRWLHEEGVDEKNVTLLSPVPLKELSQYISAADIGLISYEDFEVRKYCSPVKTGEYLLCGLPILVQRGTSEDDEYAEKENVGIVLETFNQTGLQEKWSELESLMREDKTTLRARCRNVGLTYRGEKNALELMRHLFTSV